MRSPRPPRRARDDEQFLDGLILTMLGIWSHLKRLDWTLLGALALVFVMGLMVFYGSPDSRGLFWRQLLFGLAGFVLIFVLSFFDWRILRQSSFLLMAVYAAGAAALFVLFVVGARIRGVVSWFRFGAVNLEPVEMVKIVLVAFLAKYFSARHIELYRWRHIFISGFYAFLPAALVLAQPDLGSAAILFIIWLGMVLVAGIKPRQFLWLAALFAVAAGLLWMYGLKDYQKDRVASFLYPERDPLGGAYQGQQALIAIGSGGWWGKGLGAGTQTRLGFLPEYQTDFIFAAIAEEWGFVGMTVFLWGWFLIFWRLRQNVLAAPDNFSRLFIGGFTITLGAHFLINIGANLGFLPITGLPLSFVSYGGSNLIGLCAGMGVVQAIRARAVKIGFSPDAAWWSE